MSQNKKKILTFCFAALFAICYGLFAGGSERNGEFWLGVACCFVLWAFCSHYLYYQEDYIAAGWDILRKKTLQKDALMIGSLLAYGIYGSLEQGVTFFLIMSGAAAIYLAAALIGLATMKRKYGAEKPEDRKK